MLEGNRGCIVPKSGYHMALDSGFFGGRDLTFSLKKPMLQIHCWQTFQSPEGFICKMPVH